MYPYKRKTIHFYLIAQERFCTVCIAKYLMFNIGISMKDVIYILAHRLRISELLPWDRKFYLTHAILSRTSSNAIM